jgi:hypothetical protein
LRIAKVSPEGEMSFFAEPFPMPSVEAAANREGAAPDAKRFVAFYERPELCLDSQLGIAHRSHIEEGFGVYASSSELAIGAMPSENDYRQVGNSSRFSMIPSQNRQLRW